MDIWPDGDAPDRLVMAAEARAQTRARNADGSWAVADPVRQSDYEDDFPGSCTSDPRGTACADHTAVEAPAGEATAPQTAGRVAIAFASLADNSRCTGEARQGRTRAEENLLVVRGFPGAGGAVPRARNLARMGGNGDPINWDQIADPRAFLALCHGMKG
ncbi:hypothetical protein [uncultured Paracoccus sp.]|uniref:hypothetical protein n=1 Tax=uncultured Paracoccus sp. TaxID=189685 RepID=UPI0025CE8A00|nr:hypothetical protein [uncultured Paracoccus sp.]